LGAVRRLTESDANENLAELVVESRERAIATSPNLLIAPGAR
jgi:hypothetical protein